LLTNNSTQMFTKLLETKKEIMISSELPPQDCKFYGNEQIKWLYCVPKYPCKLNEINFSLLKHFDGFSNHCPDISAPLQVINLNSEILEIHITSDKNADFVDNNVSFDYDDMKEIAKQACLKRD